MDTERLIEQLAGGLQPVRRWRHPGWRAATWLLAVAVLTAALVMHFANLAVFAQRVAAPRVALECIATALTGVTAVFAAFMLTVPGNSTRWMALPLPPFLLWLGTSGLGCLRNGWVNHGAGGIVGESAHCFVFILGASVPLAVALFATLRRARPIAPAPVAVMGLLGVAAIAAFVLQFFHPFDVTAIDLGLHLTAVGLVVLIGSRLRRPLLAAA
jgi:hypothetical protein